MAQRLTPALIASFAVGVGLCLTGCGPASSTPQPTSSPAPTQLPATPPGASPSVVSPQPSIPPSPTSLPTAVPTPLIPGVATISLLTAETGGGLRPQLAWAPVAGAATYRVTVFAQDGRPYWSWEGSASSVFLGGGAEPLPEDAPGPRLAAGMSWVVFAGDADGVPIAASSISPISP